MIPPTLYLKDGAGYLKGDVRYPEYIGTIFSVFGVLKAGRSVLAVDACWIQRGDKSLSFQSAKTYDPILKFEHRMGYLKSRPQNEWEAAGGVDPPLGLKQWLDIVCPLPTKTKKEKK